MSAGISRVHGSLIAPKNFAGVTLQDFTLTFWNGAGETAAVFADSLGVADGALDQTFRTALSRFASLSRVGTLNTDTAAAYVHFAIEALGASEGSDGYLGTGPSNDGTGGEGATTAAALQAVVRALGTVNSVHLSSATVVAFTY